jgi:TPP-dependent trihydroxycyclohexane-1,2-dione (THcHDO) dehydratase
VIYAGQGVHYAQAWPQLKRPAERLAIPVTTSLGGKSSFPETHPLSLGSGGLAVPRAVPKFLAEVCPTVVTWEGWRSIDVHETGLGEPLGRPRVKLVRTGEMVDIASAALSQP